MVIDFMSLLLRFYDVDSGVIRIGNINIKEMKLATLMSHISAVFQMYTYLMTL
ncbi:ABC transporter ATP-binding protein [Staphylococcus aureus]|uniref:ABC transporter ATP-binding protein n=1 Tax=Staphylococcus aureus TaxID=1280 RepID=A0A380DMV8_STAAU|nr:ABC transporter ATP-binding protein [Staphylococcus aureus]